MIDAVECWRYGIVEREGTVIRLVQVGAIVNLDAGAIPSLVRALQEVEGDGRYASRARMRAADR